MVGFLQSPKTEGEGAAEEEKEDLKTQTSLDSKKLSIPNEPLELLLPELEDIPLSFSDCFLDFDYSNGCYTEGIPELSGVSNMTDLGGNPVDFPSVEGVLGASKEIFKVGLDGVCVKEEVVKNEEIVVVERSVGMGCQKINENEGCLIEEEMGKVSLDGNSGRVNENVNNENDSDSEEDSDDESSSSTSSSSSSSSSSDDDEEEESGGTSGERKAKNVKKHMDMEEGEIMLSDVDADEMVGWSDNEDDDVGSGMSGPITSKNELKVLPPVPPVNVTLQPHHQTLPVGVILSILGAQVIVEGVEKHNPLNDGSILWITERRSPLGIVDEIFGPVKNPYYVVRYNSEIEVPTGIQQGTLISFVQEFSDHILNEKSLYQKGYDASGENDEELSEQLEFSDDEKEAEYKRSLKMKKRGKNDSKSKAGPKRKEKWQQRNNNNNSNDNQTGDKLPVIEEQTWVPPLNQENHSGSSGLRQDFPSSGPPTGIWSNNNNNNLFPHQHHHQQQQQSLGLPPNGMLWMQQQNQNPTPFQLYQTPLQMSAPPLNFNPLAGQPNFGAGPTWPPPTIDQNMLYSLQFGMGLPGQHPVMQSQGSQIGHSLHAPTVALESPPNFNQGRGGGVGGRDGYHRGRGRGRSSGMRGRY